MPILVQRQPVGNTGEDTKSSLRSHTHLPIRMRDPNSDVLPEKPIRFDEMKKIAAVLSKGLPHLRVDFYCANGRLYVGELTFYHCSGFAPIQPEEWAIKMGDWIKLPTSK